jgi:membrane protease YdiL (CAAX protease family)
LLYVSATILIQIFYAATTNLTLVTTEYFPYGYLFHIIYYASLLSVTFLFVGKSDFGAFGLKRVASWKKYLLIGLIFALLGLGLRILFIQGTFGRSYYTLPYYLLVPAFVLLGLLIGLTEESAFRGYILKNFLEKYKPVLAILFSSFLFGVYHINFSDWNFYTSLFWTLYVVQALTGGIIIALLFYKTGGNLIGSVAYHSSNIISGQIFLWMPLAEQNYLLGVETIINIVLFIILMLLPINAQKAPLVNSPLDKNLQGPKS